MAEPEPTTTGPDDPWEPWRRRITASQRMREDRVKTWQDNVEKRKAGKGNESTEQGVRINKDWPLTKAKQSQLYSQDPELRLTPKDDLVRPATQVFSEELNAVIKAANVGATIEEELADVINAAGIGACLISCQVTTEPRQVPSMNPIAAGMSGQPVTYMTVDAPVDWLYRADRLSPAEVLIPTDFTGSDYDKAPWLGREGRLIWSMAQKEFGLTDEQKDLVVGGDRRASRTTTSLNTDTNKFRDTDVVNFTEIFYWRYIYHPDETRFAALQRLVFVDGLDEPVIDEPYKGQKRLEDGRIVGVLRNPIQPLTLTYISDEALPPSDSTIARTQIDELEDIRDLQQQQRKHSIPVRWYNPNVVSPNTKALLEKGTPQGFVPVANGERGIGEIARASFPPENFEFERLADQSLSEIFRVGTNQSVSFAKGDKTAAEVRTVQQNFQTGVAFDRDKVSRHFVRIAEVMAGHLAIYGQFELPSGIPREIVANGFLYDIRPDSTVRLDAEQEIERINRSLNMTAQSGFVNPKEPIARIWELSGFDPAKVVIDPQPKPPEPANVSLKGEDLLTNAVALAHTMRTGQGPTPEDVAAAIKIQQLAQMAMALGVAPAPPPADGDDRPPRETDTPGIANAGWEASPRVERRAEDGGA